MTTPPEWTPNPQWSNGMNPYWTEGTGPPGPNRPRRDSNAAVAAIIAVTVAVLVGLAVYAFSGHHGTKTFAGSSTSATPTRAATTPATTTPAPTTPATTTPATTTPARTTPAKTTSTKTAASSTSAQNTFNSCTNTTANLDLINLTVALSYSTSYASADPYNRSLIENCTTVAVRAKLTPYYGKVFGSSFTDLTGNNDLGPTDRYLVPLVNTTQHVSFTLKRKSEGPGFRVIAIS